MKLLTLILSISIVEIRVCQSCVNRNIVIMTDRKLYLYSLFLLSVLLGCGEEDEVERTLRTEMSDAFFEYTGSELAVIEITAGLRQLDEEKGFSVSFVDNYGYPVWNESKIIPIDSEEVLVVLPVRSRHEDKIPALWIFLAHDNVVSNVVLTKEMARNSEMDWEWGFDYFTQKMYLEKGSSKYHFHELDKNPQISGTDGLLQTRSGVLVTYCVDYTVEVEFQGQVASSSGTHCWNEYYSTHTFEVIDHIDHPSNTKIDEIYVYNQQGWGGGGTAGTSPYGKTPEERFGRACKIGDGIMEEYKGTLISAVDYFATTPLYSDLYGILATRGSKITFQVDPLIGTPAQYDGKTNTISFRTVIDIIDYNTNEELVHAAQKVMYGSKMTNDIKNFEFEAKVIQDIVSERLGFRPFRGNWGLSDPFASEYDDFIELLGSKKKLTEKDLQVYFKLLSDWSNSEYEGDIEFSVLPMLLMTYIVF